MDKVDVCQSYSLNLPARDDDSLYPMCVGVNCAFLALEFLSKQEPDHQRWSELSDRILQGSAHLLGLLVWRVQRRPRKAKGNTTDKSKLLSRLEGVEKELQELKRIRREDGKANQRVTSIYASQEQNWFTERKKLRQQIGGLMNELRIVEKRKDGVISELQEKLRQKEVIINSKDKNLEEEGRKKKELEEEMKKTAGIVEELKEKANHESQAYASEIWKHKSAFIELISNQRQIESEMGRALRQAEAAKQQLEYVFEEKEESLLMIQKLSIEIEKLRKDCDQKDKILSAMLRKSKSDTVERQVLLTEIKFSIAKRKKAELETEKWRLASETRNERHTLKSMFLRQVSSRFEDGRAKAGQPAAHCRDPGIVKDTEEYSPESEHISPATHDDLSDAERVESWFRAEAEKYQTVIEQKQ